MSFIGQQLALRFKISAQREMANALRTLRSELKKTNKQIDALKQFHRTESNRIKQWHYAALQSINQNSVFDYIKEKSPSVYNECFDSDNKLTITGQQQYANAEAIMKQSLMYAQQQEENQNQERYELQMSMLEETKADLDEQIQAKTAEMQNQEQIASQEYDMHKKWNETNLKNMT